MLNIIKICSSKEHPVTQTAICEYLNDIHVFCDRKTVGRNISYLQDFGYPIKKIEGRGYYLDREEMKLTKKRWIL